MALIACGECGREISDRAATCPHCGAPASPEATAANEDTGQEASPKSTPKKKKGTSKVAVAVVAALVGACVLAGVFSFHSCSAGAGLQTRTCAWLLSS